MLLTKKRIGELVKRAQIECLSNSSKRLNTKKLWESLNLTILPFKPGEIIYRDHASGKAAERVTEVTVLDDNGIPRFIVHTVDINNPKLGWRYGNVALIQKSHIGLFRTTTETSASAETEEFYPQPDFEKVDMIQ